MQLCDGFEKAVNSLHARGGWDIYLTGSNAFLLSSDLATLLTGRHREVHFLSFGFGEYRAYFDGQGPVDDAFDDFVRRGGLAGSYDYADLAESYGYIRDVYTTILTRDLVQKFSLPDTHVLERLAEYMMDNSSNPNSANKIARRRKGRAVAGILILEWQAGFIKSSFEWPETFRAGCAARPDGKSVHFSGKATDTCGATVKLWVFATVKRRAPDGTERLIGFMRPRGLMRAAGLV